jgi:DNA-binding LacI/PurR family transcriptional regulator
MLSILQEFAEQLPKKGRARIIVLTGELTGDADWRLGAYQQFLRDDSLEDAIYDSCR